MADSYTIWVCGNCVMHQANGECGDCHREEGHEGGEPLSRVDCTRSAMGMGWEDHAEGCETYESQGECHGECDCETETYSTSTCEGCGSDFHGKRHAMTVWEGK